MLSNSSKSFLINDCLDQFAHATSKLCGQSISRAFTSEQNNAHGRSMFKCCRAWLPSPIYRRNDYTSTTPNIGDCRP
jgi:hypothetical protein